MISTTIKDGHGTGQTWKINGEGVGMVLVHPHPPKEEQDSLIPFSGYMTLNNDGTTTDMRVDGSTTEQVFSIKADRNGSKRDRYISSISFIIADAGATLNSFGNIGALSVGCDLVWKRDGFDPVFIGHNLISNFTFVRMAEFYPSFGDSTTAFRASNVSGSSEAFVPVVRVGDIFGLQWGMRLRHGTNDRIELIIKDNVTGVDQFDAQVFGSEF